MLTNMAYLIVCLKNVCHSWVFLMVIIQMIQIILLEIRLGDGEMCYLIIFWHVWNDDVCCKFRETFCYCRGGWCFCNVKETFTFRYITFGSHLPWWPSRRDGLSRILQCIFANNLLWHWKRHNLLWCIA